MIKESTITCSVINNYARHLTESFRLGTACVLAMLVRSLQPSTLTLLPPGNRESQARSHNWKVLTMKINLKKILTVVATPSNQPNPTKVRQNTKTRSAIELSATPLPISLVASLAFALSLFTAPLAMAATPTPAPSPTPALGNYPNTSVPLSSDTTVTPDAAPTNTTSINVSTDSNFNGTFAASSTTGVVTVTDAHPAGTYTVTVTAFGPGGATTKTFTLTVTSTPCGFSGFTNAADVNVGPVPYSVAIGDFNGDGKQDLAVVSNGTNSGTVSIRLGDGLGGFSGSTEVSVGSNPVSVAIGDFNGDGKQDLAVTN
jgi:PKD repeat protein